MAVAFDKDIRRFDGLTEFANYALSAYPNGVSTSVWKPIGATVHNTYIPNRSQWRGMTSMNNMVATYISKGWSAGPHLYIALGTSEPRNDGIYTMTPLGHEGVHAGTCNDNMFGVEIVDDFEINTPTDDQINLLVGVLVVLASIAYVKGIQFRINAHKDCMANRTCPGSHMYSAMSRVRTLFSQRAVSGTDESWALWGEEYPLPKEQRLFGIPSKWYSTLLMGQFLGRAKSFPVYQNTDHVVTQLFENGLVLYRDGASKVIWYKDLGK